MNKRGLSPIIATILLIAFAVAIGAMIMNWTTGGETTTSGCEEIPNDFISQYSFCQMSEKIVPRLDIDGKMTTCKDKAYDISKLPIC